MSVRWTRVHRRAAPLGRRTSRRRQRPVRAGRRVPARSRHGPCANNHTTRVEAVGSSTASRRRRRRECLTRSAPRSVGSAAGRRGRWPAARRHPVSPRRVHGRGRSRCCGRRRLFQADGRRSRRSQVQPGSTDPGSEHSRPDAVGQHRRDRRPDRHPALPGDATRADPATACVPRAPPAQPPPLRTSDRPARAHARRDGGPGRFGPRQRGHRGPRDRGRRRRRSTPSPTTSGAPLVWLRCPEARSPCHAVVAAGVLAGRRVGRGGRPVAGPARYGGSIVCRAPSR